MYAIDEGKVRTTNRGKLEVVRAGMTNLSFDILGIIGLKRLEFVSSSQRRSRSCAVDKITKEETEPPSLTAMDFQVNAWTPKDGMAPFGVQGKP